MPETPKGKTQGGSIMMSPLYWNTPFKTPNFMNFKTPQTVEDFTNKGNFLRFKTPSSPVVWKSIPSSEDKLSVQRLHSLTKKEKEEKTIRDLMHDASFHLHQGAFEEAIEIGENCKRLILNANGKEHSSMVYVLLLLGEAYTHSGKYEFAKNRLFEAKKIIEKKCKTEESEEQRELFAGYSVICYSDIGYFYRLINKFEEAYEMYYKVLKIRLKTVGLRSLETATVYNHLGIVLCYMGKFDYALKILHKAREIRESLPVKNEDAMDLATVYNNLGNVYFYKHDFQSALNYYKKGKEIIEFHKLMDHPDLATCYNNMGSAYKELKQYDEALNHYQKALKLRLDIFGEEHSLVASCFLLIGNTLIATSKVAKGQQFIEQALAIRETKLGKWNIETAKCYSALGNALFHLGQYNESLSNYQKARRIYCKKYGEEHIETIQCDESIANLMLYLGKHNDSLKIMNKVLKSKIQLYGKYHPFTGKLYFNLTVTGMVYNMIGKILLQQGRNQEALIKLNKAKEITEYILGVFHECTATVYMNIGHVNFSIANFEEALKCYRMALSIREQLLGKDHKETIESVYNLSLVHISMEQYQLALDFAKRCRDWYISKYGDSHEDTVKVKKLLANIIRQLKSKGQ